MFTSTHMVVSVLQDMYPKAKDVWIRRAAEDSIKWALANPKPTKEQMEAQEKRISIMCKKGTWF